MLTATGDDAVGDGDAAKGDAEVDDARQQPVLETETTYNKCGGFAGKTQLRLSLATGRGYCENNTHATMARSGPKREAGVPDEITTEPFNLLDGISKVLETSNCIGNTCAEYSENGGTKHTDTTPDSTKRWISRATNAKVSKSKDV